jgi:AcrR family transcriptional regulator
MADRGKRARAKRGEGSRLRDEIVKAAMRLCDENGGPSTVSVRGLARAVGATPPALYLHFKDKGEILAAAAERRFQDLERELDRLVAGGDDALETLASVAASYVRFGIRHRELYRILTEHAAAGSAARPPGLDHLASALRGCVETGALDGDSRQLAALLWAALHGLVLATGRLPDLSGDAAERFLDLQIEGLLSI